MQLEMRIPALKKRVAEKEKKLDKIVKAIQKYGFVQYRSTEARDWAERDLSICTVYKITKKSKQWGVYERERIDYQENEFAVKQGRIKLENDLKEAKKDLADKEQQLRNLTPSSNFSPFSYPASNINNNINNNNINNNINKPGIVKEIVEEKIDLGIVSQPLYKQFSDAEMKAKESALQNAKRAEINKQKNDGSAIAKQVAINVCSSDTQKNLRKSGLSIIETQAIIAAHASETDRKRELNKKKIAKWHQEAEAVQDEINKQPFRVKGALVMKQLSDKAVNGQLLKSLKSKCSAPITNPNSPAIVVGNVVVPVVAPVVIPVAAPLVIKPAVKKEKNWYLQYSRVAQNQSYDEISQNYLQLAKATYSQISTTMVSKGLASVKSVGSNCREFGATCESMGAGTGFLIGVLMVIGYFASGFMMSAANFYLGIFIAAGYSGTNVFSPLWRLNAIGTSMFCLLCTFLGILGMSLTVLVLGLFGCIVLFPIFFIMLVANYCNDLVVNMGNGIQEKGFSDMCSSLIKYTKLEGFTYQEIGIYRFCSGDAATGIAKHKEIQKADAISKLRTLMKIYIRDLNDVATKKSTARTQLNKTAEMRDTLYRQVRLEADQERLAIEEKQRLVEEAKAEDLKAKKEAAEAAKTVEEKFNALRLLARAEHKEMNWLIEDNTAVHKKFLAERDEMISTRDTALKSWKVEEEKAWKEWVEYNTMSEECIATLQLSQANMVRDNIENSNKIIQTNKVQDREISVKSVNMHIENTQKLKTMFTSVVDTDAQ